MSTNGSLYIIAAPSGAGKTSLVNALLHTMENVVVSISYTTRIKRPSEVDGVNYFFVDQNKFEAMVDADDFLEHASVFGQSYGTSKLWVEKQLQSGCDVILEIDWQGAHQVQELASDSVSIFIAPPSYESLLHRLQKRAQDDPSTIESRMAQAKSEMSHCEEFDYLVINNDFDTAVDDLQTIMRAHRLLRQYQQDKYAELLSKLL